MKKYMAGEYSKVNNIKIGINSLINWLEKFKKSHKPLFFDPVMGAFYTKDRHGGRLTRIESFKRHIKGA